jgi:hypothetical protein
VTNFLNANKYVFLGIIGSVLILMGYAQSNPQAYYIIGSTGLLLTAIHYQLVYFIALELILIAGHSAILMGMGHYTQIALPLLLCFQLLIFYLMVSKQNSIFLMIGIVGIALLSLGLSYHNQWVFFSGSSAISIYAYYNGYKGIYPSYIWAGLNTLFSIFALYKIINQYGY